MINDDGQRRHIRVRDDIPVNWVVDRVALSGRGILRNLSVSGAMLEAKVPIMVEKGMLVSLKAEEPAESAFVPPAAEVVWGKAAKSGNGYFFMGFSSGILQLICSRRLKPGWTIKPGGSVLVLEPAYPIFRGEQAKNTSIRKVKERYGRG